MKKTDPFRIVGHSKIVVKQRVKWCSVGTADPAAFTRVPRQQRRESIKEESREDLH